MVDRVSRAIDQLGYVRNDAARKLRAGVSATAGFVVLEGRIRFTTTSFGAEDEAMRRRITILHGNTDEEPARERMYLEPFQEQQVCGLLIARYGDITPRLRSVRTSGIAAVLVHRFSADGRFSSVSVDSVAGGQPAGQHLIDIRQVNDRLAGARVAPENAGSQVNLEFVAA